MNDQGWLDTYRGTVFRWEVDNNDHLTVAYYFARLADATGAVLHALGLGAGYTARTRHGCPVTECFARYVKELRVGDILHVTSGVVAVEPDALVLGHKLFNSETGDLCTTIEQRLAHVDGDGKPAALGAGPRAAAETRRIAWDAPAPERRPRPAGLAGFRESARDTVAPGEMDAFGRLRLGAYIHRFSAANAQALAGFGLSPGYMREAQRGFSTFEFQCTFADGLAAGDPVVVRTGLTHVGNSSMRLLHVMSSERTGQVVASLEQSGVQLDLNTRRPAPLADELRRRAQAMRVPPA
jgi:acyl-CoA thioester hydrolase